MKKITGIFLTLLLCCATFVSAQVTLSGATEATPAAINKSYATLSAAFAAIHGNASGLVTDNLILEVTANVTETAQATLYAPLGISSLGSTLTAGTTTYKYPQITLTGGTNTATGTFVVTIYNGKVTGIACTSGAWTVAPTSVTIEGAGGPSGLNVTTQATAICSGTGNLSFTITNGGAGYGPITTVTPASGGAGAGAAVGLALISAATTPSGSGPYIISPTASVVSTNVYLDNAGTGYNLGAISTTPTGGTVNASGTTASYTITTTKANYASVKIYPTAADLVISASNTSNQPYITLMGTSNVTFDGRVHSSGVPSGAANLTIQYNCTNASSNNGAAIYLNVGANHNTISYCKLKSVTQNGNTRGTLAIGTNAISRAAAESSVGGSYNTISYNEFSALNPNGTGGTNRGNGSMLTSANFNDDYPSTNNIFEYNTFDNYFINGPVSNIGAAIQVIGNANPNKPNHSNYTIRNNSFFNSVDGATTASANRMFIKVGTSSITNFGGFGHTISGNFMGGKAAGGTGGTLTKTGAFGDNMTCIYLSTSYGAASTIENNVIKNISTTNGGGVTSNTTRFIDVNGYGPVTVSGNTIGDNATGSIVIDNGAITGTSNMYGIYINANSNVTCENNSIGSITVNPSTLNNFAGIWKTASAGDCTISNNTIGNASTVNSILNNSGSTQWVYPIYSAGTGTINVNGNTIANITNNTTTGNLYGIFHESGANTFNANANLIHSLNVTASSTTAKVVGVFCNSGTNTITNNIVKLDGDNAATIYGLDEEETAPSSSFYHNTVYLSGTPTTLALNSACMSSNGNSNTRNIKNNIFVNARTNSGTLDPVRRYARTNSGAATGVHYALLMPSAGGTIAVDANDYQATGSGAMLGSYGGADVSSGSVIVTGQDANSQNVDPGFASAGGTLAANYKTSTTLTGVSAGITTDYSGTSRTSIQMGAWDKLITAINNLVENDGLLVTRINNQLVISYKTELKSDASVSVYNMIGKKLVTTQMINAITVLENTFQSGIYLVTVTNAGKTVTKKIIFS